MRIDSHQHFWSLQRGDYRWLNSSLGVIYRDFTPQDLKPLLANANIEKTILVQAADTLEETHYLLDIANKHDFIAGVVGWIDMLSPNACEQLHELKQQPKLLGIRPMLQDIEEQEWMLKPELDSVYQALIQLNICFDALVDPARLKPLLTLLQRYPKLKLMIDHGAKPAIAENEFERWATDIAIIAANSNAYCKLSGLLSEAKDGAGIDELKPYMQHLLNCFGPKRLCWGSDWPVLNLSADYSSWLAITETFLKPLSTEDREAILGGNAQDFYHLT
jgi:L-fuconolactonase